MSDSLSTTGVFAGVLTAVVCASTAAWGQSPPPDEQTAADTTLARQLGNQGLELASSGNCAAAVDPLSRSEALHHAPTTLTVLGECHVGLGKLVQGAEELTRVVRENIDARAPASYRAAQDRARALLDATRPRLPKLRILVTGPAPEAVTLSMDGQSVPAASLGIDRPVDPGHHRIEVRAKGYEPASGDATLREGEVQTLTLTPVPRPVEEASEGSASADGSGGAPGAERAPRSNAATFVALGVGVAGVAAGTAFGIVTLSKTSGLDGQCSTRTTCPASAQSSIDFARTTAWTSNIAFGVGGVGLVTALFLALRGGGGSEPPKEALHEPPRGPTVTPQIGVGSLGLRGTF